MDHQFQIMKTLQAVTRPGTLDPIGDIIGREIARTQHEVRMRKIRERQAERERLADQFVKSFFFGA